MSDIALIDPLTLLGEETLTELARRFDSDRIRLFHDTAIDEHQVTAAGGHAMLVPRIASPEDFAGCRIVILCGDDDSDALDALDRFLEENPGILFIDASKHTRYGHLGVPVVSARNRPQSRRLRLADPSLVMTASILDVFSSYRITTLNLSVIQPASAQGKSGIEKLARQSIRRIQGENLAQEDQIVAFNIHTGMESTFQQDASRLFPDIELTGALSTAACFHGHFLQLSVHLTEEIDEQALNVMIRGSDRLVLVEGPMNLDQATNGRAILIGGLKISREGRLILLHAMADGSRIGGSFLLADLVDACL